MKNVPKHIVLFPDGNRRWAKNHGLDSFKGHLRGEKKFDEFLHWCKEKGVIIVTVFGFSTENWKRPEREVQYLMNLFEKYLGEGIDTFNRESVRVNVIGQKEKLPSSLQAVIKKVEKATKNNKKMHLNLAVSYGGKWDIINAVKKIIDAKIPVEHITEEIFNDYVSTAGLPDPDLIIRVGGQMRLSNFLLWQGAYSELYFSPKLWPDFTQEDFGLALQAFDARQRRYGA